MTTITINAKNHTIEMNKTFAKAAFLTKDLVTVSLKYQQE